MKQYINFDRKKSNYSVQHGFVLFFKKVETILFSFLCIIFLIIGKINDQFSKDLSFFFIDISLPVVKIASFPFNSTINLILDFNELIDAKKKNKILESQLEELKSFYTTSINIEQENKELRAMLNFVSTKSTNFKVANIISKSHQIFNQSIFVDAGEDREIKENAIVIGKKGIIGRVIEVGKNKSRVMLLNDAVSRIPVITSKSRIRGILAGNGSSLMEILYLPKIHNIENGEMIFTSGDGDTLTPGLLVGVVKKIESGSVLVSMIEDGSNFGIVSILEN